MTVQTDRFLFIHVPKTGGIWFTLALKGHLPDARQLAQMHSPLGELSPGGRQVVSLVRDPWSWYASWYFHITEIGKGDKTRYLPEGCSDLNFRNVLYGCTHPETVPRHDAFGGYWPPPDFHEWERWQAAGFGWYSYVFHYMWADTWPVTIATDRLVEGTEKFLGRSLRPGFELPKNDRASRQTDRQPYSVLYDDEMVQWVADAEADVINRFGFRPFLPSPKAIYGRDPAPRMTRLEWRG